MNEVIKYLKLHGEQIDQEIAVAIDMPLAAVRLQLADLAERDEIVTCQIIKFKKGTKFEGTIYRVAGYSPPASPGRKPKVV
ncbi:MAG: ArsR family transcriptional regulator [Gallionellaceae bacterium]